VARCDTLCALAAPQGSSERRLLVHKALTALRSLDTAGFKDHVDLSTDPDLEGLHAEPGFRDLLADMAAGQGSP
jgi:hypothetical protein